MRISNMNRTGENHMDTKTMRATNENSSLSTMTVEDLNDILKRELADRKPNIDLIKNVLTELRLRGKTDDELYDIEKAWEDFLEQSSVALYELDELK